MKEEWRDIKGWAGYYQVSNKGRVRSLPRIVIRKNGTPNRVKGKIISFGYVVHGYVTASLWKNGIGKTVSMARLVATAFIRTTYGLNQVNHKNRIITDNRTSNLEWCTNRENVTHGKLHHKKTSQYTGVCKPTSRRKWKASIQYKGKVINLGSFTLEKDAALAYRKALKQYSILNRLAA